MSKLSVKNVSMAVLGLFMKKAGVLGHVSRMNQTMMAKKIFETKLEG
jgi:hypothetical protein